MRASSAFGAMALLLLPTRLPVEGPGAGAASPRTLILVRGTIAPRTTLAAALAGRLSPVGIHELVEASRPLHDLARVSAGRRYGAALEPGGRLAAFTYEIDEGRTLRVERRGEVLAAEIRTRAYEVRDATVSGAIASSLFAAVAEAGEEDQLALDLADVFAWDVDFHTEIRRGDRFRVAVEKLYLEGRFVRYGRILAAELVRGPRLLRAVRYEGAQGAGYYAPDGTPLRKAFLRSPLRFTRISSRFSRGRLHPVLKQVRPHMGIDYAAPAGTPVVASADGVVTLAGWSGSYGKAVRLRHGGGFETLYGHLGRILVRQGQSVAQGTVIGTVGSTGLATGPHLDYRMIRGGAFVNPLRVASPVAPPLPPGERAAFEAAREAHLALLEGPPRTAITSAILRPLGGQPSPE